MYHYRTKPVTPETIRPASPEMGIGKIHPASPCNLPDPPEHQTLPADKITGRGQPLHNDIQAARKIRGGPSGRHGTVARIRKLGE